jgi:hypothetical protein
MLHTALAALLCLLPGVPAKAQLYGYTLIADTSASGPFSGFDWSSLNDAGTLAFVADLRGGGQGIFTGDGRSTTTLYDTSGPFTRFSGVSINNAGTVAFGASLDPSGSFLGDNGIFAGSGGPTTTIADNRAGSPFRNIRFGSARINNAGTVAFVSERNDRLGVGIFTGTGGSTATLVFDPLRRISPSISFNDRGQAAYYGSRGGDANIGIRVNGGAIANDGRFPWGILNQRPSINNNGEVAFSGFRLDGAGGGHAISTNRRGIIVDVRGAFSDLYNYTTLSINDAGTVAFTARLDDGGFGLFTGPDPAADRVLLVGDTLFSSTVTGLGFAEQGLNNQGQVAFFAALADGRRVLVRAEVVPEPGTALLLASGAGMLLAVGGRGARRRHSAAASAAAH